MRFSFLFVTCLGLALASQDPPLPVQFKCVQTHISALAAGVQWEQLNCSSLGAGVPFWGPLGPLLVNLVTADLSLPSVRLMPVRAAAPSYLQPLNAMAADGRPGLLAGINAGYFWRTDVSSFVDFVCQGKYVQTTRIHMHICL